VIKVADLHTFVLAGIVSGNVLLNIYIGNKLCFLVIQMPRKLKNRVDFATIVIFITSVITETL